MSQEGAGWLVSKTFMLYSVIGAELMNVHMDITKPLIKFAQWTFKPEA